MLIKYVSIPIIIFSFLIGLLFIYILGPEEKLIYVYPNPTNFNNIQYKDGASTCFEYILKDVKCPFNPFSINTIPSQ